MTANGYKNLALATDVAVLQDTALAHNSLTVLP